VKGLFIPGSWLEKKKTYPRNHL